MLIVYNQFREKRVDKITFKMRTVFEINHYSRYFKGKKYDINVIE